MWVNPELGRIGLRQEAREAAGIKFLFIGSLAGLAIGLAVDCAINGRPLREDWAIHRRLLPLIVMATATLAVSAYCLWRIMTLPPTNY
jgi:hypothetical protein